ncbi:MAG TPA: chromate efflux transporter [Thermoanaerobaculia bacterium]|nr:chromate efflux transporter [Thermoanaerobaculia bacterium]
MASGAVAREGGRARRLGELARLFLKLGVIGFGGPAAHIAMLEDEVVRRRRWLDRQHFLDLVGATNLIPGPNSTEMAMHVGFERAGWLGLATSGACFILPAVAIAGGFAWLYVTYGALPEVEPFLRGIEPAVLAVILGALWKLGRQALQGWRLAALGAVATAAVLAGADEVATLFAAGLLGMLWLRLAARRGEGEDAASPGLVPLLLSGLRRAGGAAVATATAAGAAGAVPLGQLFLFFLKVGAVLYGSGYVLVAFLEGGLVRRYGWLTEGQLLDAVALGQLMPGPVLSTATFIGYVLAGAPGAAVATVGIFLPSFLFVLALNPLVPKLRRSAWMAAFLDAVNVAAVGLMAAVTVKLGAAALTSWPAWLIAGLAAAAALRFRVNAAWLVLAGALLGRLLGPWSSG